jgi:hypothetical membrane protein
MDALILNNPVQFLANVSLVLCGLFAVAYVLYLFVVIRIERTCVTRIEIGLAVSVCIGVLLMVLMRR